MVAALLKKANFAGHRAHFDVPMARYLNLKGVY